jgi:hypothetical protein
MDMTTGSNGKPNRFGMHERYRSVFSVIEGALERVARKELSHELFLEAVADFLAVTALVVGEKCLSQVIARMQKRLPSDSVRAKTATAGL